MTKIFNGKQEIYELNETQKIKALGFMKKFFNTTSTEERAKLNKTTLKKPMNIMSKGGIIMIKPLTVSSKILLWEYCSNYQKNLKLDYEKEYITCFSDSYMFEIIKVLKETSECDSVKIQSKTDSPISLSNEHFEILLAPMFDGDY